MHFSPTRSLIRITPFETQTIAAQDISFQTVGEKAFGISCLPEPWTLPFLVVSSEHLSAYRNAATPSARQGIVQSISKAVLEALPRAGLSSTGDVYVRSSAVSEPLEDRGRYHSFLGSFHALETVLTQCLSALAKDPDLQSEDVHLVIQQAVNPVSAKGHLSNERRCYEEARDWLGEFEVPTTNKSPTFSVNLRKWRSQTGEYSEHQPLACNLEALVSKILRVPAWWAKKRNLRVHFEWVWDGKRIYLVQADQAKNLQGADPTVIPRTNGISTATYQPKCLASIQSAHADRYNKIRNVQTYLALQLPITNLYVLDDPIVLDAVRAGMPPSTLVEDLEALVPSSLVIRTDLATDDQTLRQLLPRTNEVRTVTAAIAFLQSTLEKLAADGVTPQVAFIFHNFIPAVSSAFAYAAPGQRKVLIEALWGLPEGLYYNAHDKIEVDTGLSHLGSESEAVMDRFKITVKPRFKRNYVAPDDAGNWIPKWVSEPWDWRPSIRKEQWIRQIAFASKRIAEKESRALSVMWFVEVPSWASTTPIFPWYHEPFDFGLISKSSPSRQKTPFDRSLTIRTKADVDALRHEASIGDSLVCQVRIQPKENELIRDKELLKSIGELTKAIGAVILLEGGTLSHAYYQLMQTQAIVEVAYPFDASEEKREFNKLVRDNIPQKIQLGGESVRFARLAGDQLLRVLREKLVEEAYEALDASDHNAIIDELADVEEVIEGILKQLKVKRRELTERQRGKKAKAGGFDQGFVLLETHNPSPTRPLEASDTLDLELGRPNASDSAAAEQAHYRAPSPLIARWSDRREHGSANERILNLVVSLMGDHWSAESPDINIDNSGRGILRATIHGQREGGNLKLEISVFSPSRQLRLFDD